MAPRASTSWNFHALSDTQVALGVTFDIHIRLLVYAANRVEAIVTTTTNASQSLTLAPRHAVCRVQVRQSTRNDMDTAAVLDSGEPLAPQRRGSNSDVPRRETGGKSSPARLPSVATASTTTPDRRSRLVIVLTEMAVYADDAHDVIAFDHLLPVRNYGDRRDVDADVPQHRSQLLSYVLSCSEEQSVLSAADWIADGGG